ncbi:MAG TPA: asparagine synthase (glutamine-hydrolyzing), partial [Phycisphaerales bacterium]|nr:asparagine synthase (glutamine-hydrolyzing) [Phycisphaerales bacterium]
MCGIGGILGGAWAQRSGDAPAAMSRRLAHRGPDGEGMLWLTRGGVSAARPAAGSVEGVLVHRRLAILDPSEAGRQPMSTPDGRYHIVYNGEIYNYVELREELEAGGLRFSSGCDTEVLLAAWARWGEACLSRLVGMFAFAVHDAETGETTLARDLFGIKPLFYSTAGPGFAFASEIKALLTVPGVGRGADAQAVYDYLVWNMTGHDGRSFFADIRRLRPGFLVRVGRDGSVVEGPRRWGSIGLGGAERVPFEEAAERVRSVFLDNVRLHLRSDVEVGCALSGGVDSSAVVAGLRSVAGEDLKIRCFSHIAEDDPAINEERWVDLVAGRAGVEVIKSRPSGDDLARDLDGMIAAQDEPFGSTSIYAQCRVFRLAREHGVRVMLSGQGADELLAGYRPYTAARVATLLARGRLGAAGRLLWASRAWGDPKHTLMRALWLLAKPAVLGTGLSRRRLRRRSWLRAGWFAERGVVGRVATPRGGDRLRSMLHDSAFRTSLPALLRFEDRNAMAESIESRVPFLTPGLAGLLLSQPEEYLLGPDGETKRVFKAA